MVSCVIPELVWLAAGSLNGLTAEKYKVLKNRNVILYPDLEAFEKWSEKTKEIQEEYVCRISVSTLPQDITPPIDKANGLNVADFIIDNSNKKLITKL